LTLVEAELDAELEAAPVSSMLTAMEKTLGR
jgi:hypothetical protein